MNVKIKTREDVGKFADSLRADGKIIVTTNGAFDILHPGHIYSLQTARGYGGALIVGLNSDESIKRYKGLERPFFEQKDRAFMLSALECVDAISIFDEDDPREFLRVVRPHYHVKSRSGYKGVEEGVVRENGGQVQLIDDLEGYSTTDILHMLEETTQGLFEKGGLWSG